MPNVMSPLKWYAYNIFLEFSALTTGNSKIVKQTRTFRLSLHLKTINSSALMMKDTGAPDIAALQARGLVLTSIS